MNGVDLSRDWLRITLASGATAGRATIEQQGTELLDRWNEPHRRYHDGAHLVAVLAALDRLAADATAVGPGEAPPPAPGSEVLTAARLAAWFHDAVYDGRPGADEEASAVLAQQVLGRLGVAPAITAEVARLVRLTTSHDPADGDLAGALLVDADLAVLAGSPDQYARYASTVRAEYSELPDQVFRLGRAAVLNTLLDKPFLFRTPAGRRRWESAARANLAAELAALDAR